MGKMMRANRKRTRAMMAAAVVGGMVALALLALL